MIHELKTWEEFFGPILTGNKTFEIRKNDRNYKVGDTLRLLSYDPIKEQYTGGVATRKVTYILEGGNWGLEKGFVIMGIQ